VSPVAALVCGAVCLVDVGHAANHRLWCRGNRRVHCPLRVLARKSLDRLVFALNLNTHTHTHTHTHIHTQIHTQPLTCIFSKKNSLLSHFLLNRKKLYEFTLLSEA
jgi:hypothetical protein